MMQTDCGDGVASVKPRRRDLSSDDVEDLTTTSGRNRLKSDLEDSTCFPHLLIDFQPTKQETRLQIPELQEKMDANVGLVSKLDIILTLLMDWMRLRSLIKANALNKQATVTRSITENHRKTRRLDVSFENVENLCPMDPLQQHVKHAKKVRARKMIIIQPETIRIADLKRTDTNKAMEAKVYHKGLQEASKIQNQSSSAVYCWTNRSNIEWYMVGRVAKTPKLVTRIALLRCRIYIMGLPKFTCPKGCHQELSFNLYVAKCGPAVGLTLDFIASTFSLYRIVKGVYLADERGQEQECLLQLMWCLGIILQREGFNTKVMNFAIILVGSCMTRSSTKELLSPFENPKQKFRSKRRLFDTPSLVKSNSSEFDHNFDVEDNNQRKKPTINQDTPFELKGKFLMELHDNTFSGSEHEDANEHIEKEVILFYNGLDVPTRQILDSKGAIPSKTVADAKIAIQELAEYSQKWHNETLPRTRSTKTSDGLAAIKAQLNNLGREIKKVNEKVYAAQVRHAKLCKGHSIQRIVYKRKKEKI
ncbi:hypothetical protein Tco_1474714 [Tanacetum coccineum]